MLPPLPRSSCGTTANQCASLAGPTRSRRIPIRSAPPGTAWAPISRCSPHMPNASSFVCSIPTGRREIARLDLPECTDEVWHGYLPNARTGSDLRLSRPRSLQSRRKAIGSIRTSCLLDPYAKAVRRDAALVRCAIRLSHQFAARRSLVRPARQRPGHAEGRGQRRRVRLGRRPPAQRSVVEDRHL